MQKHQSCSRNTLRKTKLTLAIIVTLLLIEDINWLEEVQENEEELELIG